ncbi:MAG: hypothetical protein GSR79_01510 [Desulfurococcales archaeon]|nr:hypothetical protein [Desulfurococcales archaeon]
MNKNKRKAALPLGLPLLLALILASIGGASALWYKTMTTDITVHTGELDWEFRNNTVFDSDPCTDVLGNSQSNPDRNAFPPNYDVVIAPEGKDVGCTGVQLADMDGDGDYDTLNVTLNNVYPYYATEVDFRVWNIGTIPLKIWRIQVILDNGTIYEFTETNPNQVENEGLYLDLNNDTKPDVLFLWGDNFGNQLETGQNADISLHIVVLQTAPQGATLHFMIGLDAVQWNEYENVVPQSGQTGT